MPCHLRCLGVELSYKQTEVQNVPSQASCGPPPDQTDTYSEVGLGMRSELLSLSDFTLPVLDK